MLEVVFTHKHPVEVKVNILIKMQNNFIKLYFDFLLIALYIDIPIVLYKKIMLNDPLRQAFLQIRK